MAQTSALSQREHRTSSVNSHRKHQGETVFFFLHVLLNWRISPKRKTLVGDGVTFLPLEASVYWRPSPWRKIVRTLHLSDPLEEMRLHWRWQISHVIEFQLLFGQNKDKDKGWFGSCCVMWPMQMIAQKPFHPTIHTHRCKNEWVWNKVITAYFAQWRPLLTPETMEWPKAQSIVLDLQQWGKLSQAAKNQ